MDPLAIGDLMEHTLAVTFTIAAPPLFVGLIIGVLISLVQAATQVNEVTLVFIPKMIGVGIALWLTGPSAVQQLSVLFQEIAAQLASAGG